jgi:hypothetical protein
VRNAEAVWFDRLLLAGSQALRRNEEGARLDNLVVADDGAAHATFQSRRLRVRCEITRVAFVIDQTQDPS